MAKFNKFERLIASQLHKHPFLKQMIKSGYQRLLYIFYKKNYKWKGIRELQSYGMVNTETFWGYYDKSPISNDNKHIAYNESVRSTKNKPDDSNYIYLKIVDVNSSKIVFSEEVRAFNWQQGCRAQWLSSTQLIYNDYDIERNCYVSKMVNLTDQSLNMTFDLPVYDCFKNEFAYSISFERLMHLRPDYGYRAHELDNYHLPLNDNDGLYFLDLKSGKSELIMTFTEFLHILPITLSKSENIIHKFNHLMLSPNGSQLMFLHRYYIDGTRFDRLVTMDTDSHRLRLLADDGMVSHCCWYGDNKIIGYLRHHGEDAYYLIDLSLDNVSYERINELNGYGDGHPSISSKGHLITDTYPDKSRMKNLILLNINSRDVHVIGEVFEGLEWEHESRCDLHPRFSFDGKSIYFDSVHEGKRQLYVMENPLNE
ncbi:putative glycosyltransferase [Moritella sp. JT01]|uniref:hypothetical protein n=1 Tax=Moritella sp. JT01 TaxID=756698 RepID=UPI000793DF9C|nr:hypothetical protein [Moritella sp. JT01]KXO13735.1 putative glycosyltransferase [Moritella sp. JT01]